VGAAIKRQLFGLIVDALLRLSHFWDRGFAVGLSLTPRAMLREESRAIFEQPAPNGRTAPAHQELVTKAARHQKRS
jgi:hypothetical protein